MLTQIELDKALAGGCQNPECKLKHKPLTEVYLDAKCHPAAGLSASYHPEGFVRLECDECGKPVGDIAVAK